MVTYPLNELQPGMIVAADVFTPRGQLIVLRGSILSQQMIQHMKYYHVPSVTILPNEIDPMSFEKADRSEPTYAKRIRQSESFKEFREHYTQSASIFQEQLSRFVAGDAHLDTSALLQDTLELFDHNRASFSLLDMLHNMRDLDDSTYVHSINVAVISRMASTASRISSGVFSAIRHQSSSVYFARSPPMSFGRVRAQRMFASPIRFRQQTLVTNYLFFTSLAVLVSVTDR